jgi:hypothetical protein
MVVSGVSEPHVCQYLGLNCEGMEVSGIIEHIETLLRHEEEIRRIRQELQLSVNEQLLEEYKQNNKDKFPDSLD